MNGLRVERLVAGYGAREVLRGVDLAVARGERLALVGPNGSGKTTLLRACAGIVRSRSGAVLLDGVAISTQHPRERARRIGYVPQTFGTPFAFTAREIVAMGRTPYTRALRGLTAADRGAVDRALADTDCGSVADRPYAELSGGERQRVVLAMALAQEADVLLLDEPTTHLDLAHQLRLLELVAQLAAARGLAVLAALHDLALAAAYFDRLVVLDEGRLVADGPARSVLTPALLREVFDVSARVHWQDGVPTVVPELACDLRRPATAPGVARVTPPPASRSV